ncbi:aggregation-promoting factor C-terminal-like domain-containing protein [Streptosporangium sandarakinum]
MTDPTTGSPPPPSQTIVKILNIKKLEDAASSFADGAARLGTSHDRLTRELTSLTGTLGKLVAQLQAGANQPGPSGRWWQRSSASSLGGSPTFSGIPLGTPPQQSHPAQPQAQQGPVRMGGGRQTTAVNGGGSTFTQPAGSGSGGGSGGGGGPVAPGGPQNPGPNRPGQPGTAARLFAAAVGMPLTATRHAGLETTVGAVRYSAGLFERQALKESDDQLNLGTLKAYSYQYRPTGMSEEAWRSRVHGFSVGYVPANNPLTLSTTTSQANGVVPAGAPTTNGMGIPLLPNLGNRGHNALAFSQARSWATSTTDNLQHTQNMLRMSGGKLDSPYTASMEGLSAAIGVLNPGLGATEAGNRAFAMTSPQARMRSERFGLGDPMKGGKFEGTTEWAKRFLKRVYQGRKAVDPGVFEADMQPGKTGHRNLQLVLGREDVDDFVQILRAVNKSLWTGQEDDLKTLDKDLQAAGMAGSAYDGNRARLKKQGINIADDPVAKEARNAARTRESDLTDNDAYLSAHETFLKASEEFSAAVRDFTKSPVIGEVSAWAKALGAGLGPMLGGVGGMAANGVGILSSQGAGDAVASGGAPAFPATGAAGLAAAGKPGGGGSAAKGKDSDGDLGTRIARYAESYTSRPMRYTMSNKRTQDGWADCSSFVSRVFAHFGYEVGPTTAQLNKQGRPVGLNELQPGDVLLSGSTTLTGGAAHTAIYVGAGKYVDANSRRGNRAVQEKPLRAHHWDRARRIIGGKSSTGGKENGDDFGGKPTTGGPAEKGREPSSGGFDLMNPSTWFGSSGGGGGAPSAVSGGGAALGAPGNRYGTTELEALSAILSGGTVGGGAGAGSGSAGASPREAANPDAASPGDAASPKARRGVNLDDEADAKDATVDPAKVSTGARRKDTRAARRSASEAKRLGSLWTENWAPRQHPAPNISANKATAKKLVTQMWGAGQWPALEKLWMGESGFNQYADNPTSDAYGIPQALPPDKMSKFGKDYLYNPATQIRWGLDYIKSVYGTPARAYAKWSARKPHWYDKGAWSIERDELAVVHKDEMIIPAAQAKTIRETLVAENLKPSGENGGGSGMGGSGAVNLTMAAGSIVVHTKGAVTEQTGRDIVKGLIAELKRRELHDLIAQGVSQ